MHAYDTHSLESLRGRINPIIETLVGFKGSMSTCHFLMASSVFPTFKLGLLFKEQIPHSVRFRFIEAVLVISKSRLALASVYRGGEGAGYTLVLYRVKVGKTDNIIDKQPAEEDVWLSPVVQESLCQHTP
jgi:hypothetical protein